MNAQLTRLGRSARACLTGLMLITLASSAAAQSQPTVVSNGDIVLYRHALAPGSGDPADFRLGDCTTQRLLNDTGRAQARRIGEHLRQLGSSVTAVWSSQWCRTMETAELAFPEHAAQGRVEFNSFYANRNLAGERTAAALAALSQWSSEGVLVVVTHQVNITALVNVWPKSGEGIVIQAKDGVLEVTGRIAPP